MFNFKAMNNAAYTLEDKKIVMPAFPKTDFFVNPENGDITGNAAYLYEEIKGDFSIIAKVSHEFIGTYDACVLLAHDNETKWAKACFEATDLGTKAVVSVMTNGRSDDANGVNVEDKTIWLKLSRKNNTFAVHYSYDGEKFLMARICSIPMNESIKVGIVAQSPLGDGATMIFENLEIKNETLSDIRSGK